MLVGGIGAVLGGYFAASALSASAFAWPTWSWRIMWFLNLPTGLILVALSPLLPESAALPAAHRPQGRGLLPTMRPGDFRFGAEADPCKGHPAAEPDHFRTFRPSTIAIAASQLFPALTLAALAWDALVNFGILLWFAQRPGRLAKASSVSAASGLIAKSTLIAAPTVAVSVWLYSAWSTAGAGLDVSAWTALGAVWALLRSLGAEALAEPIAPLAMLIVGSSGVIPSSCPAYRRELPASNSRARHGLDRGMQQTGRSPRARPKRRNPGSASRAVAAGFVGALTVLALAMVLTLGRETRAVATCARCRVAERSAYRASLAGARAHSPSLRQPSA
ncbi:hypothetical protein ACRAWD_31665 [Caulobacter segnis]